MKSSAVRTAIRRDLTTTLRGHSVLGGQLRLTRVQVRSLALALMLDGSYERCTHASPRALIARYAADKAQVSPR